MMAVLPFQCGWVPDVHVGGRTRVRDAAALPAGRDPAAGRNPGLAPRRGGGRSASRTTRHRPARPASRAAPPRCGRTSTERLEERGSLGQLGLHRARQLGEQNLAGLEVRELLDLVGGQRLAVKDTALDDESGLSLAKSRRPFAASTGSPLTKAMADGPANRSSSDVDPGLVGRDLGQRVLHHGVRGVLTERTAQRLELRHGETAVLGQHGGVRGAEWSVSSATAAALSASPWVSPPSGCIADRPAREADRRNRRTPRRRRTGRDSTERHPRPEFVHDHLRGPSASCGSFGRRPSRGSDDQRSLASPGGTGRARADQIGLLSRSPSHRRLARTSRRPPDEVRARPWVGLTADHCPSTVFASHSQARSSQTAAVGRSSITAARSIVRPLRRLPRPAGSGCGSGRAGCPGPSWWRPGLLEVPALRRGRLEPQDLVQRRARSSRPAAASSKDDLADDEVQVRVLVDAELDLAALDLGDGLGDVGRHGAGLRVRHEAAGTEHTAEAADLAHQVRGGDDGVEVEPALRDLVDQLVGADDVGAGGSAASARSPVAKTRTRAVLPVPCGRFTVPRTIWSALRGSTPRRKATSTVASNLVVAVSLARRTASSGAYRLLPVDLGVRSAVEPCCACHVLLLCVRA